MKKSFLLLLSLSLSGGWLGGCSDAADEAMPTGRTVCEFSEAEALMLERMALGETRTADEIAGEALSVVDFTDEAATRSPRRVAEVIAFPAALTRAAGLGDERLHAVNFADGAGFAIACSDRRADPVWAAVPTGNFDPAAPIAEGEEWFGDLLDRIGEACRRQIDRREREERELIDELLRKLAEIDAGISETGDRPGTRVVIENVEVTDAPWEDVQYQPALVTVKWHQRYPFNDSIPRINGQAPPAGCTAVAIAQIMSYHRQPADFDWDELTASPTPETTAAEKDAARLCRIIGENVDMQYGLGGSGALLHYAPRHFAKMGYANAGSIQDFNYDFDRVVENLTEKQIPVGICGSSSKSGKSHSWVLDGFLERRRLKSITYSGAYVQLKRYETQQLLHCNFGWRGDNNGYYNNEAFITSEGPVTTRNPNYDYDHAFVALYDVQAYVPVIMK